MFKQWAEEIKLCVTGVMPLSRLCFYYNKQTSLLLGAVGECYTVSCEWGVWLPHCSLVATFPLPVYYKYISSAPPPTQYFQKMLSMPGKQDFMNAGVTYRQNSRWKWVYLPVELSRGVSIVDVIRFIFLFISICCWSAARYSGQHSAFEANLIIFLQGTLIYGSLSPLV